MSLLDSYVPVPVDVARKIAQMYQKQVVVIIAEDHVNGQIHATTYGVDTVDKIRAAELGPLLADAAGGFTPAAQVFEDFRDPAIAAQRHDKAIALLERVIRERESSELLQVISVFLQEVGGNQPGGIQA